MLPVLSSLTLAPLDLVCVHEAHEPARLAKTCEAIRSEGMLRHPILAFAMADGRYLVLDGAHRTAALQALGCRRAPLQVVPREGLRLGAWEHLVPCGAWLRRLRQDPCLRWADGSGSEGQPVAEVWAGGTRSFIYPSGGEDGILARLPAWHRAVFAYATAHQVRRLPQGTCQQPAEGMVLMRYPGCRLEDVMEVVAAGQVMPPGVTRFVVEGRLLNLCTPLELLMATAADQTEWERLLRQRAIALRFYSEGIYLCEI